MVQGITGASAPTAGAAPQRVRARREEQTTAEESKQMQAQTSGRMQERKERENRYEEAKSVRKVDETA